MAAFRDDPDALARLDWRILQNGAVCLYFRQQILAEDRAWLHLHAYVVHEFRCDTWRSIDRFHDDVSQALQFPGWYGRNLHAFNDLLADVAVPDEGGMALVLRDFNVFAERHRDEAQVILDMIADNSRRHMLRGRRLVALVQSEDPRITFDPVGAQPVTWNPSEWLGSKRGL